MKEIDKEIYIAYCRKSSEDSHRQIASVGDQLQIFNKIVEQEKLSIACAPITEEKSAKEPGRPEFNKMLKMLNDGIATAIWCYDIDRLSRNPIDGGMLSWMLQNGVIKVIRTPGRSYYPEDAGLLLGIEQGRATDFVIRLSKNVKRGLNSKAMRGWRPSGGPIGYLNLGTEKGNKTIGIDPERFPLVRRMWDMYLTGHYTVRELHTIVNEQWGLRTPQKRKLGGKKLTMSHMYTILNNQFYMGKFPWKDPDTGEVSLMQGVHTPMITEQEFERAQILLGVKARHRSHDREFAYTGLAECGECHSAITAEEKNQLICTTCKHKFAYENKTKCPKCNTAIDKMHNPTILHYVYYRCTKKKKRNCTQKYIRLEQFEEQLADVLDKITIDDRYVKVTLDYLRDTQNLEVQDHKSIIESLEQAHKQCEARLERFNI
jgi:DNA invertase Pin-like site-specific DNA recombinase